ncbi:MAG TPA: YciI family protein [Solirubrobacteraceae bacterium]|nr:YciI family protein [Solirubrobacteraceae bacterium]
MQYVLFIYQGTTPLPTDPDAWATLSEGEQQAIFKDYAALNKTPGVSPGLTLGLPKDATTVQVQDGRTVTREGPYLSEGAGGYLIFEADQLDAAIDLASRIPAARHGGAIEVRPVVTYW